MEAKFQGSLEGTGHLPDGKSGNRTDLPSGADLAIGGLVHGGRGSLSSGSISLVVATMNRGLTTDRIRTEEKFPRLVMLVPVNLSGPLACWAVTELKEQVDRGFPAERRSLARIWPLPLLGAERSSNLPPSLPPCGYLSFSAFTARHHLLRPPQN